MPRLENGGIRRPDGAGHDQHGSRWRAFFDQLAKDLGFAMRGLGRNPAFTVAAIITIAIGIGATTAVVSIANAVLLRPPPVVEPDRLVSIWELRSGSVTQSMEGRLLPYERFEAYRAATGDVFEDLAGHHYTSISFRAGDEAEALTGVLTSGNYFQLLGLKPAAGRFFSEDHEAGVVLSARLWRRRFNADPAAVGSTVYLNSRPITIIGVAPEGFSGLTWGHAVDLWVPVVANHQGSQGSVPRVVPFGRLHRGMAIEHARQQIAGIAQRIPLNDPQTTVSGARLDPVTWRGDLLTSISSFLNMLFATGLVVLLIASANIAGMLIARAIGRRREIAVRLAIGASRLRLVRQLLTESVLLFLIGGAAGIVVAFWATRLLSRIYLPVGVPTLIDLSPDPAVLAAVFALILTTGLLFGLGPALHESRPDLVSTLKASLGVSGGRTARRRSAFVVAQLALSVLLLVTAGLFVRSVRRGMDAELGFDPADVVVATIDVGKHDYDEDRGRTFQDQLIERVRNVPGVTSVAYSRFVPLGGESASTDVRSMDGDAETDAAYTIVDTAYFSTMHVDLIAGHGFTAADRAGSPHVAVVNETFARRLWSGENAVGKRFRMWGDTVEVIGVTRDGKYWSVTEEQRAFVFRPAEQAYTSRTSLHIRTRAGATAAFEHVRAALRGLDPNVALEGARMMDRIVELSLFPQRFALALTGLFGLIGMVLAAIGVYGVLSMHVAQRGREFGIRMALGARRSDVLRLVLARGAVLATAGVVIGLVAASAATGVLRSFLYGVSPLDSITFAIVAIVLVGITLVASYVPARRATLADPLEPLRQE